MPSASHPQKTRPVIVALHGFLSSSRYWTRLERHLHKAGFTLIAVDLLGFGKAQKPKDSPYDYDAHIAHIQNALHQKGADRPFILMGHSMGALVAARYANLYPKNITRTILLHPPLYKNSSEAHRTLRDTSRFYAFLLDSRFRGLAWGTLRNASFSIIARHTKQSREDSLQNIIEAAELFDDLATIRTPTLLVNGLKDRPVYRANLHQLQNLPNVQIVQAPVAHHSPIFNPRLVTAMINRFTN